MARDGYDWSEDPWNEESQRRDEEELRHASRMGWVGIAIAAAVVIGAAIAFPVAYGAFLYFFGVLSAGA